VKSFPVERAKVVRNVEAERKAAEEFTKKLISLGYLSAGAPPAVEKETAGDASSDVRMTAHGLSNLGVYLAEQRREKEALPYFERAIAADPSSASFRENRADALERLGRVDEADREIVKACALGGPDATDRFLAHVVKRVNAKQIQAAIALLERADRELSPPRPELADALGRLYVDQRRCPEAKPIFERLTSANPLAADAWVMLARARRCLGETDGARQAYDRALALAPDERTRREAASLK
jgi:Flp pilus assembly protein TadD